MKKTLLITLLLIPFLGIAQTTKPIEGFLGIKFGSSKAAVSAAIAAKGGILDKKSSSDEMLAYKNVKLGHRGAGLFAVKFINGKAFEADFFFDPGLDAKTIEYYYALVNDINENYGTGSSKTSFKSPYSDKDDDGDKIIAIKNAEGDYRTYWQAPNKNTIMAYITEELAVVLQYQDAVLTEDAVKAQKSKEKSDY
jgi:hypothetical protein